MEGEAQSTICISVQSLAGEVLAEFEELAPSTTVRELRRMVTATTQTKGIKLVYNGETMRNDRTIGEEGLASPAILTAVFLFTPEGCVGHWSLQGEGSDGCEDLSGNGNKAVSTQNKVVAGDNSYIFSPGGGLVVTASASLNVRHAMTVTCWFKLCGSCDGPLINFEPEWNAHVWVLQGKLFARMTNQRLGVNVEAVAAAPMSREEWHFLAATHSTETGHTELWVDGKSAAESQVGYHELGTGGNITIGTHNGRSLSAELTDLRLFGRVLSAEELELVAGEMPPPEAREISFPAIPVDSAPVEEDTGDVP